MLNAGWKRITVNMKTKDLVQKIEKLARERMAKESVIDIKNLKRSAVKENACILLIEDDETIRKALTRMLEGEGYRVRGASDGTQLSEVLDDAPLDLIMMDIGLPWVNGLELTEMMKAHDQLKRIPLILISGRSSKEDIKKGFAAGCDDYLTKPFDLDKIKKTVSTLLQLAK